MKRQILVVHGGGTFIPQHGESFLDLIALKEPDLARMRYSPDWKANLRSVLGESYDVLAPRMPNADAPRYEEWKAWFEKILPLLNSNTLFVGHSLGGMFLAKYFSEQPKWEQASALFSIAAPYGPLGLDWELGNVEGLDTHAEHIFLYHSTDDPVVDFSDAERYKQKLPNAVLRTFSDRQHFNGESFPELVADIKSI